MKCAWNVCDLGVEEALSDTTQAEPYVVLRTQLGEPNPEIPGFKAIVFKSDSARAVKLVGCSYWLLRAACHFFADNVLHVMSAMPESYPVRDLHFFYVIKDEEGTGTVLLASAADLQRRLNFIANCDHVGVFVSRMTS